MATTELTPQVQWMAAAPLWGPAPAADPLAPRRPTLLRFAGDDFMEQFAGLLQTGPAALAAHVARPESFQARPLGEPLDWISEPPEELKLYQPAHGRFYLVTAALVCRLAGLPDRVVDKGKQERVDYVLRRLTDAGELAWAVGAGGRLGWVAVPDAQAQSLRPGEERLPLFPLTYDEGGRRRRLLAGLIPTASRETFQAGAQLTPLAVDTTTDPRQDELQNRVLTLLDQLKDPGVAIPVTQAEEVSTFVLLDLVDFLLGQRPLTWIPALQSGSPVAAGDPGRPLFDLLGGRAAEGGVTWLQALRAAWAQRDTINAGDIPAAPLPVDLRATAMGTGELKAAVTQAIGPYAPPAAPPETEPVPKLDPRGDARYVLRCVYDRPDCAPFRDPVVSEASAPFVIASFFDPDAPARTIRIPLPIDTSPAGLRKFQKNVGFVISDKLRQQMGCVDDAAETLKGNVSCGAGVDFGLICQFSIPIITICALIVLMIFVALLNIVFWWMPFLRICLPVSIRAKS